MIEFWVFFLNSPVWVHFPYILNYNVSLIRHWCTYTCRTVPMYTSRSHTQTEWERKRERYSHRHIDLYGQALKHTHILHIKAYSALTKFRSQFYAIYPFTPNSLGVCACIADFLLMLFPTLACVSQMTRNKSCNWMRASTNTRWLKQNRKNPFVTNTNFSLTHWIHVWCGAMASSVARIFEIVSIHTLARYRLHALRFIDRIAKATMCRSHQIYFPNKIRDCV